MERGRRKRKKMGLKIYSEKRSKPSTMDSHQECFALYVHRAIIILFRSSSCHRRHRRRDRLLLRFPFFDFVGFTASNGERNMQLHVRRTFTSINLSAEDDAGAGLHHSAATVVARLRRGVKTIVFIRVFSRGKVVFAQDKDTTYWPHTERNGTQSFSHWIPLATNQKSHNDYEKTVKRKRKIDERQQWRWRRRRQRRRRLLKTKQTIISTTSSAGMH